MAATTGTLQIGGDSYPDEFFAGRIDEVRVYNRALTQAEIQADMNTAVGGGTPNTAPAITAIANQITNEDTPTSAIDFTVGDAQTAAGSLTLSGSSNNTTLVPNGNIVFGGSGASRSVTVTPAANRNGMATITVTVSDGQLSTPTSFQLTVNTVNDAPTITSMANQTTTSGTAVGPIAFTVGDAETAAGSLMVTGSSSNLTLVPNGNIVFGGTGANRTVTVTAAAGQTGNANITVTVSDGQLNTPTSFQLTVNGTPSGGLVAVYGFNEGLGTAVAMFRVITITGRSRSDVDDGGEIWQRLGVQRNQCGGDDSEFGFVAADDRDDARGLGLSDERADGVARGGRQERGRLLPDGVDGSGQSARGWGHVYGGKPEYFCAIGLGGKHVDALGGDLRWGDGTAVRERCPGSEPGADNAFSGYHGNAADRWGQLS